MRRRYLVGVLMVTLLIGAQVSLGYAATAPVGRVPSLVQVTTVPDAPDVNPVEASQCLRGGMAECFGVGTENCCGEMGVAATIAWIVGNYVALAVASAYLYAYC